MGLLYTTTIYYYYYDCYDCYYYYYYYYYTISKNRIFQKKSFILIVMSACRNDVLDMENSILRSETFKSFKKS